MKDKIDLIKHAKNKGYKIISAMGAGNRYKTCQYTVTDIFDTKGDALARKLRGELRKCEVDSLEVVYTDSESVKCKEVIGSVSYIPALCGSIMSAHIINKLIGE